MAWQRTRTAKKKVAKKKTEPEFEEEYEEEDDEESEDQEEEVEEEEAPNVPRKVARENYSVQKYPVEHTTVIVNSKDGKYLDMIGAMAEILNRLDSIEKRL